MKKKTGIIIVLILIVIIGGVLFFLLNNKSSEPKLSKAEDTVKTYMSLIKSAKYDEMYDMLSDSAKESISKDDFVKRNKNIYTAIEASNITLSDINEQSDENDDIKVTYKSDMETVAGHLTFDNTIRLEEKDDKYYIKWTSNVIVPGLNNTDKLRLNTTGNVKRGNIYDRNGKLLAGEGNVSSIGFVPGKMRSDSEEDIEKTAELLEVSKEKIKSSLSASYVKEDTFVEIARISASNTDLENKLLTIPGIKITNVKGRVYPYGEIISNLTGYVGAITKEEVDEVASKGYTQNSVIRKKWFRKSI